MPLPQILAFSVIIAMMALFVWGRLRYDLVALLALFVSIGVGIVPADRAFKGFSDDIVVIIASALVTSAAVSRSGLADGLVRRVSTRLTGLRRQILALAGTVMLLSAVVKNIGALSMLMPPAFDIARRTGTDPSRLLMPMSFASLLGGLVTLVGTSPNIIVSRIREDVSGSPFRMFDFAAVGLPLALIGLAFLLVGWRLLPTGRRGVSLDGIAGRPKDYTAEAIVPGDAKVVGWPVAEIEGLSEGDVSVAALIRDTHKRFRRPAAKLVRPDDRLLLEGEAKALEQLVAAAGLKLAHSDRPAAAPEEEILVIEAVVTADSLLVGRTVEKLRLSDRFGVTLVAVARAGERIVQRLKTLVFRPGDLVVFRGPAERLPDALTHLGCLPLAGPSLPIGQQRRPWLPVVVLAIAMTAMALQLVPVALAFFAAAVVNILLGAITPREAYAALDAPVLVTLACLIPVSDAMRTTGAADVVAGWLAIATAGIPPLAALAVIMVVAMAVTPFLNNAATVLVAGPIAAGFAAGLGYSADPFLMAVAVGAASDFLTPIGHQCNMLVMGPGGYRFGDYWRLGLPLSLLVVLVGVPLIAAVWPLVPA